MVSYIPNKFLLRHETTRKQEWIREEQNEICIGGRVSLFYIPIRMFGGSGAEEPAYSRPGAPGVPFRPLQGKTATGRMETHQEK